MELSRASKLLFGTFLLFLTVGCMDVVAGSSDSLRDMVGRDHLAGGLGTTEPALRARLNSEIDAAAGALASMAANGASDAEVLEEIGTRINAIDRDSLDTEDAEKVASAFEAMLEPLGLHSSEGILNTWLYGFDPG